MHFIFELLLWRALYVLEQDKSVIGSNDVTFLVSVEHAVALAAQPPFCEEEDPAITFECKHSLLLVKEHGGGSENRTPKPEL